MEAGKMQLFDEPYDTCSLFHDLRISMENRIGHSGLELIYDIDQDIPCKLKGDMGRIRQVIINLVNNAIKYTEKGSVRFSVHVRQKNTDKVMLYYEVADTGIGDGQKPLCGRNRTGLDNFPEFSQYDGRGYRSRK
jgi:signal transduction histidine kinase